MFICRDSHGRHNGTRRRLRSRAIKGRTIDMFVYIWHCQQALFLSTIVWVITFAKEMCIYRSNISCISPVFVSVNGWFSDYWSKLRRPMTPNSRSPLTAMLNLAHGKIGNTFQDFTSRSIFRKFYVITETSNLMHIAFTSYLRSGISSRAQCFADIHRSNVSIKCFAYTCDMFDRWLLNG